MSRPAVAMQAGQQNKKFIFAAMFLGLVGAVLVYVAFSRDGGGGGGPSGSQVPVVVAKSDIAARTTVTASMLEVKLVAESDRSALAYTDTAEVVGQITRFPITANEQVLTNKVVTLTGTTTAAATKSLGFVVPAGKRGMAIDVTQVVSAGGLVLPGDLVDIIVVYDISFQSSPTDASSREEEDSYFIHTILQAVEVLAVSQTLVDVVPSSVATPGAEAVTEGTRPRNTEAKPAPDAITVTLALTPEEAQKLYLAASNGRIRLSVRPFDDHDIRPIDPMVETDLFPRNLPNPFIR